MSGIMHKIGDTLHIGGDKGEHQDKQKGEHQGEWKGEQKQEHKPGPAEGEKKEGFMEKIKDKIQGDKPGEAGEKKKKKEKKKPGEGGKEGGSSSSSDSD